MPTGPPIQTQSLASLQETFDIAAFARVNIVGFVLSISLLVLVVAASARFGLRLVEVVVLLPLPLLPLRLLRCGVGR